MNDNFGRAEANIRRIVVWLISLSFTATLWAAHGIVQTSNGKKFEGDVRLASDGVWIADARATNQVELNNLALLRFQPPVQTNSASATGAVHGLRGTYFSNDNFTGRSISRIDPVIDFNWADGAPVPGIGSDNFSVRWEGKVEAPTSEKFTFHTHTDDGVRLWINNRLLLDWWHKQVNPESTGEIDLEAGRRYDLKMEYFDQDASAMVNLSWSSPSIPLSTIPTERLFPPPVAVTNVVQRAPPNALLGMYFNEPHLTGEFKIRYDATIDFDWGDGAPLDGISPERFSVRWLGKVIPLFTEHFTFHTITDDGVRLWVNNMLVIDAWREEMLNLASVPMVLIAGQPYELRMEMFNTGGRAMAKLLWSSPSIDLTVVPTSQLLPASTAGLTNAPGSSTAKIPAGVMMADGSIVARPVHSADGTSVRFSDAAKEPGLPTVNVARIILEPMAVEAAGKTPPGRSGLLLKNGDFVESEFKSLGYGQIKMSSVLFGNTSYPQSQAAAIIFRDVKLAAAKFELRTRDGSLLRTASIHVQGEAVLLENTALAKYKVPLADLLEIKGGL